MPPAIVPDADGEAPAVEPVTVVDTVEPAAALVYQEILKPQGYPYKPERNAKGNFYLNLGEEPADKEAGGIDRYRYTLVYDRPSRNGNCELFVLYRECYREDTDGRLTLENTVILDMYAVETASGRVIASGRKAWEDPGTQAYREATGEGQ